MANRYSSVAHRLLAIGVALALLQAANQPARAADPENCLSCHRYRGLARVSDDGKSVHSYHVDPNYYDRALGPHARLRCTDCHARAEVSVIPHQAVSPVNCTTTCHLSPTARLEVSFSHESIAKMLEGSVHTAEVLNKSNGLLGEPLRAGQSRCLLCHDEPVFRQAEETWAQREAPVARCEVCHTEQLPIPMDARFAFRHVNARTRPARTKADVVRVCALCHSDPAIQQAYRLPDTTASYLASFHGKAMQLGSEATAGCLDCHVGEMQNIHVMQAHTQTESPTSPAHLPDTCRSAACHPTAGHAVSTAAVHLELSAGRGVEYFIASLFVLLILFTFGPSVLLQTLEMLQIVVGRHDPNHHQLRSIARQLQAEPQGRRALRRFTLHQRIQHWILAVSFTALVVTGFPIKFADRQWARWLVDSLGGLSGTRLIHRWSGALLIAGFIYHVVYITVSAWRQQRRTRKGWMQIIFGLPMVTNREDLKHLKELLAYLLFLRRTRPAAGRFSLKEKFEYFGVFWGTLLLGATGLLMWANVWTSQHLTGRVLTVAALVHTFEAFLALLHVGVIHMIGVIFSPAVFPLSPAMFTGATTAGEMAESHGRMLAEAAERAGLTPAVEAPHA